MPRTDYWDDVVGIAEEALSEYPGRSSRGRDARHQYIHESVDGSEWIVYTANHEIVLKETRNKPDPRDVRSMSKPDADWEEMRMVAAYLAMEQDVEQEMARLEKEG